MPTGELSAAEPPSCQAWPLKLGHRVPITPSVLGLLAAGELGAEKRRSAHRRRAIALITGLLSSAALAVSPAGAEVVHDRSGHFLGVTPHHGLAPSALPGAVVSGAAGGAARPGGP